MKRFRNLALPAAVLVTALGFALAFQVPKAAAISGADFDASHIIDDAVFFNPNSMSAQDIQTFLNAKLPVCDTWGQQPRGGTTRANHGTNSGYPPPYICLKDYSMDTPNKPADAYCGGHYTGGNKSAAQIIYDVSVACGVSPKVLIVLLQKEQGLVTDDWPWSLQYRSATGYGCPDTAPCDAEYYGFFNQVYHAARQYQRYVKQANLFTFRAAQTSNIQYNPNAGCGSSPVTIRNQATAGLYNYTPYQPNAAALANLYGTGDGCSAYGNRNFWRMYIDWFGSPMSNTNWAWAFEGQWAYSNSSRTQQFTSVPTVAPNGKVYVRVKARNMGVLTWEKTFLRMGTSRPMDRSSDFEDGTWLSGSRAVAMTENSVAPGQIATFDFVLDAPATVGSYSEYFNLVADGRSWLNDLGLYFTVNVNSTVSASNSSHSLASGSTLNRDAYILSPDRQSALTLQRNGDLVLYANSQPVWSSGAMGSSVGRLVMQTDGNLVMYSQTNTPLWNSETSGHPGAWLNLQTDGNLVIYSASNTPLWSTGSTHIPDHLSYVNTTLHTGRLYPGQKLETADRKYNLFLQPDGNLVLYGNPGGAKWATGTDGRNIAFLALQPDGNLVLYDADIRPMWYSGTSGFGTARLITQQDGNLVIYDRFNRPLWATGTAAP